MESQEDKDLQSVLTPQGCKILFLQKLINQEIDFSKKNPYPENLHEYTTKASKMLTGIHRDQVYLNRSFTGLTHILKEIEGVMRTNNSWFG